MKHKDQKGREQAMQHFQVVKSEMPDRLLPYAALAWLRMEKRVNLAMAVNELTAMIEKIPKPTGPGAAYPAEPKFLFRWSGQLREYAADVGEPSRQLSESLSALDAAIGTHGSQAADLYARGRKASEAVWADFNARTAESKDDAEISKLKVDRKQLTKYVDFPLDGYIRQVMQQIDQ